MLCSMCAHKRVCFHHCCMRHIMAAFKCMAFLLRILLFLVVKYFSKFCGVVHLITFHFEYTSYKKRKWFWWDEGLPTAE